MALTRLPNDRIQLKMTHSTHKKTANGGNRVCNESVSTRLAIKSLIDLRPLHPTTPPCPLQFHNFLSISRSICPAGWKTSRQEIARHFTPAGPNLQSRIKCNRRCFRTATRPPARPPTWLPALTSNVSGFQWPPVGHNHFC